MAEVQAVTSELTHGGDNASAAIAMENELLGNLQACRNFLVPSDIISDLLTMFHKSERQLIREKILLKEESNREEAVNRLIGEVLVHGEDGFNLLLNALRGDEGELPEWWNRALESSENSHFEVTKDQEQWTVLMDAFEGQVIRKLSEGELKAIMLKLITQKVLKRTDVEQVRLRLSRDGKEKATQFMITCLRRSGDNWAWKLFLVLVQVKPDLVRKMDPAGGHSEEDENENTTGDEPDEDGGRGPGDSNDDDDDAGDSGSSASSSTADLSEDDSCHFSDDDDEKKDRDTEKNKRMKRNGQGESGHPKDLCLRHYQLELAAYALQGHNTIICAPTGSGKTRVAVYIVRQHLQRVVSDGRQPKIAFLARTVPLVTQQHKNFEKYLPNCKTICITGESDHSMHLHNLLPSYDIVVMTPKVLENHLKPEKIESLAAFSLLIFDECHHTRKGEPYNSLMKSYLKSKKEEQKNLPQIVGLTASIGVEKATTVSEAVESILNIMGNMDVTCISTVKENKKELEDTVPKPEEGHETLISREDDEISNKIKDIMEVLQNMLVDRGADLEKKEVDDLLMKAPFNKASQQYGQWAVAIRNEVRLLNMSTRDHNTKKGREEDMKRQLARDVQVLADALVAYNEALEVHDLTRPQDVLQHLQHKIEKKMSKDETTECEKQVYDLYKGDLKKTLLKCKIGNPNLNTLGETLIKHLSNTDEESDDMSDEKSRIIIFVRTRATCKALCEWLNSNPEHVLRRLKAMPFTGNAAHQDRGGMTQSDQEAAIEKFRSGAVRVLVTTSVGEEGIDIPECNLVIKYNHVGNEVTTIQTRGRSRKRGGRAILMAQPRILMQEALNQRKAVMMYHAIERVDAMSAEDVVESVQRVQRKILEKDEIQSIVKKSIAQTLRRETFSLQCCHCHELTVAGENLRTINGSHRIILDKAIMKQVKIRPKQPKKFDDMVFSGQVSCKKCKNHLGQILNYEGIDFIIVGIKFWTLLDKDNTAMIYRRWRDVPYYIPELTTKEIKEHLDSDEDDEPGQARGATGGDI